MEYLIKWKDLDNGCNTWVTEEELPSRGVIIDYERAQHELQNKSVTEHKPDESNERADEKQHPQEPVTVSTTFVRNSMLDRQTPVTADQQHLVAAERAPPQASRQQT